MVFDKKPADGAYVIDKEKELIRQLLKSKLFNYL
jgi:hypothetical protein